MKQLQPAMENSVHNQSRFDVFPRTERIYCYICGVATPIERTPGDQDQFRLLVERQHEAVAGFYTTNDIDIEQVVCKEPSCRQTFKRLPVSRLFEYKIPYIENNMSYNVPFSEIPRSYDPIFNNGGEILKHIREKKVERLEALFQAWLFFGFLHEFLGDLYKHDDYVRRDETGAEFLSLEHLPTHLTGWMRSVSTMDDHAKLSLFRLTGVLNVSQNCLFAVGSCGFSLDLREFLASTAEIFAWALNMLFPKWPINRGFVVCGNPLNLDSLTAFGWCPHEARKASTTVTTLTMKALYRQSDRRGRESDHINCSVENCNSSELVYKTTNGVTHRADCSGLKCSPIVLDKPSMRNACSMLEAGNFPLLRVEDDDTGSISLQVVPYAQGLPYIAISHVWAQGLGNKDDNALNQCQLAHLIRHMKNLWSRLDSQKGQPLRFWLDTFCCPVPKRADLKFRKAAINLMRKTYEKATHVLVIDSELETINVLNYSPVEIGCRISVSSWASRLWTMQEGQLPEDLWFQFQNTALNSHSLWLALRAVRRGSDIRDRILASETLNRFHGLRLLCGRYGTSEDTRQKLAVITRGMQNRATSWRTDEATCISNMFDLNTAMVQKFNTYQQRMKNIWQQLSARRLISRSAAFSIGPRLQLDGYTWAHSTFLNNKAALGLQDCLSPTGDATDQGLKITGSGIVFAMATAVEGFEMRDGSSRQSWEELFVVKTIENRFTRFNVMDTVLEMALQVPNIKRKNLWIDILRPVGTLALLKKHLAADPTSRDDGTCLLVEVTKREGASIYCRRLNLGTLKALPKDEEASCALAVFHANNLRNHDLCKKFRQLQDLPNNAERRSRGLQMHQDLEPLLAFDESLRSVDEIPRDIREIGPDKAFERRVAAALAGGYAIASENLPEDTLWYVD